MKKKNEIENENSRPVNESKKSRKECTVAIADVAPCRYQPRHNFDEEALRELAKSIKENGLLQPISVREISRAADQRYELIAGERRFMACEMAGLMFVPAVVFDGYTEKEIAQMCVLENLQRVQLSALEEVDAVRILRDVGLTLEESGAKIGKSRQWIMKRDRIDRLPGWAKRAIVNSDGVQRAGVESLYALAQEIRAIDKALEEMPEKEADEVRVQEERWIENQKEDLGAKKIGDALANRIYSVGVKWSYMAKTVAEAPKCRNCPYRCGERCYSQKACYEETQQAVRAQMLADALEECRRTGCPVFVGSYSADYDWLRAQGVREEELVVPVGFSRSGPEEVSPAAGWTRAFKIDFRLEYGTVADSVEVAKGWIRPTGQDGDAEEEDAGPSERVYNFSGCNNIFEAIDQRYQASKEFLEGPASAAVNRIRSGQTLEDVAQWPLAQALLMSFLDQCYELPDIEDLPVEPDRVFPFLPRLSTECLDEMVDKVDYLAGHEDHPFYKFVTSEVLDAAEGLLRTATSKFDLASTVFRRLVLLSGLLGAEAVDLQRMRDRITEDLAAAGGLRVDWSTGALSSERAVAGGESSRAEE